MTPQQWSWLLTIIGVTGLCVVSTGRRWGWLINLGAQVLWIIYSIGTRQDGFIVASICYAIVFAYNYIRHGKK